MLTPVNLELVATRSLDDDQRPLRALHQTLYLMLAVDLMLAVQKPINVAALEVQSKLQSLDAVLSGDPSGIRKELIKQNE